jgi:hypothetical protein
MTLGLALRSGPWVAILILIGLLSIQSDRVISWKRTAQGFEAQLKAISTKKNEQKQVTGEKMVETRIIYRDADKKAVAIEQAPTAPDCKTPAEIMGADL